jgi:hydrogenase maturation protein HypF
MLITAKDRRGDRQRARVLVRGAVQGVGFRPFVYRLATSLELTGWVSNSARGVVIEVEGEPGLVKTFLLRLERERPPRAFIQSLESSFLDPAGYGRFEIRPSTASDEPTALVLPDIATCPECLAELFDPSNRRHRYPFINCTNCGPRFSIIDALPYDRAHTTMRGFVMCDACRAEYEDPLDRRFHAQPNACWQCGPRLAMWGPRGEPVASDEEALGRAVTAIRDGRIVAIKGLGGFHLVVRADCEAGVRALRARKAREEKPFALMFPSLDAIADACEVGDVERRLLVSAEAPIVLLRRRAHAGGIASEVAPGNPYLGVMVPYAPLHHLIMRDLGLPVVATSGNLSDEPICTDEFEAVERLSGIADLFLVHDRPIRRHLDDSVARVVLGRELILRRARGYAPLPFRLKRPGPSVLAVGAHLKNAIAMSIGDNAFVSQHIGDLETKQALDAFEQVIRSFRTLYDLAPSHVACDLHPDYLSTEFARTSGLPAIAVQHHAAHVLSCMSENEIEPPVLGVSWDGTGFGADGTIWGGEFLRVTDDDVRRCAHLRTFALAGGDRAVREPRRSALGVLYELEGRAAGSRPLWSRLGAFSAPEIALCVDMLDKGVNAPRTSSAGRLFDAVASLAGLCQVAAFEGQAAMMLEFALDGLVERQGWPFEVRDTDPAVLDWGPMIEALVAALDGGCPSGVASARFHNTLIEMIVAVARRAGEERVVLTGGCFQNCYLLTRVVERLREEGFLPYWHQRVPPNDGGIALGQLVGAMRSLALQHRR